MNSRYRARLLLILTALLLLVAHFHLPSKVRHVLENIYREESRRTGNNIDVPERTRADDMGKVPKYKHNSEFQRKENIKNTPDHIRADDMGKVPEYNHKSEFQRKETKILKDHYVLFTTPMLGRLGNWLFQYAAVFSFARRLNYKLIVSPSHHIKWYFDLPNVKNISLENLMVINESDWKNREWHEPPDYLSHNLSFVGFFQRYTHFVDDALEIKETLKVKPKYMEEAQNFIDEHTPRNKTLVGIHVRRGSFLSHHSNEIGAIAADKKFFTKALTYYRKMFLNAFL